MPARRDVEPDPGRPDEAPDPCYVRDAAGVRYRVYDRLAAPRGAAAPGAVAGGAGRGGHATQVVAPGHPMAAAREFVREGDRRRFTLPFPDVPAVSPADLRPATLAAQVERAVQAVQDPRRAGGRNGEAGPARSADPATRAAARAAAHTKMPVLRFVDAEGTTWRVYDARESPAPPPPGKGRVSLGEYRELLERAAAREVPHPPVRVLRPGHPAATHRLFVRADGWRFDGRLAPAEVGDHTDATLQAQIARALERDPSPRGLSPEAHRARCREHRARRTGRGRA